MKLRLYDSGWMVAEVSRRVDSRLSIDMNLETLCARRRRESQLGVAGVTYQLERSNGYAEQLAEVYKRIWSYEFYAELNQEAPSSEIEWCSVYFSRIASWD
jgi:hypothetical protein